MKKNEPGVESSSSNICEIHIETTPRKAKEIFKMQKMQLAADCYRIETLAEKV